MKMDEDLRVSPEFLVEEKVAYGTYLLRDVDFEQIVQPGKL